MPLTTGQCNQFNEFLFRRTPDWDKRLTRDRQPYSYTYAGLYKTAPWENMTGTTHTWDKVFVTRPNDNGCWDEVNITNCVGAPCAPSRQYTGWGSDRNSYVKYHKDYQSPVFCFDQLRDTEEAVAQLDAIVKGHQDMPDQIVSDFLRLFALRSSNVVYICGSAGTEVTTTAAMFTSNCNRIDLGGTGNLPTSKLSMEYLDNHIEDLMYRGYFANEFSPTGKFEVMTDLQTQRNLTNGNPALTQMYNAADFAKGGKFYEYGAMSGAGNWLFKIDSAPLRFQHVGSGVLERIYPFQNVAATVGKKPQFSTAYKNAPYQMSHVFNRASREIYVGQTASVNGEMKFLARSLMGKWTWKNPPVIVYTDPNTGVQCTLQNDKQNQGYFLGEYELGVKTEFPEIEMCIIHQREPQTVVDDPRCAATPSTVTQTLTPYNSLCGDP